MNTQPFLRPILCLLVALAAWPPALPAEAITLRGRVTDADGQGLAGATVSAFAARSFHRQGVDALAGVERRTAATAATDERGMYRLEVEPGAYEIVASATGRAARSFDLSPTAESSRLPEVALPRGEAFRVRVLGAEGQPAVGALVAGRPEIRSSGRDDWHSAWERTSTGEDGAAELTAAAGESMSLRVLASDGRFAYGDGLTGRDADLNLEVGVEWLMRVHDARGRPLEGVVVHLSQARLPAGRTDSDGRFRVRVPASPPVTLRLSSGAGHYLRAAIADDPERTDKEHTFELDDPVPVDGRVLDAESGEAIAGALVWALGQEAAATSTGRAGGFSVTPLPGVPRIHAVAPGHGAGQVDFEREAVNDELTIRLYSTAYLSGRVVDAGGRGIAGARLQATAAGDSETARRDAWRTGGETFSDADGDFALGGLVAGVTYRLQTSRQGYAAATTRHQIARQPDAEDAVITLKPGFLAVGQVVDEAEQPLAGATVELLPPPPGDYAAMHRLRDDQPVLGATTGADGRFALRDVGMGSYRMEVRRSGFAPTFVPGVEVTQESMTAVAPGHPTESGGAEAPAIDLGVVVMVPGVEITGRVIDADDRPLAEVAVAAMPSHNPMMFTGPRGRNAQQRVVTGDDGRFRFADLRPQESVVVTAEKQGYSGLQLSGVTPPIGEDLKLVLQRAAIVRGRVVDDSGAPVPGLRILATAPDQTGMMPVGRILGQTQSGREGEFEIEGLPAGSLRLQAAGEAWQPTTSPALELTPGEVYEDLVLQVTRGLVLSGIVHRSDGRPVVGAELRAESLQPDIRTFMGVSAVSDAQGRFTLAGLEPGGVTIVAHHPRLGQARKTLQISDAGPTRLEIELGGGGELSGQVITPDGRPASDAVVRLGPVDAMAHVSMRELRTGSDGGFRLENVADGTWQLTAEHADHGTARGEPTEVAGAPLSGIVLQLSAGITVSGRLVEVDFDALGTAQIMAFSPLGIRMGQVSHDGSYRIEGLPPGATSIMASAGGAQRNGQIELEEGQLEATLDFDFSGGYELVGSLELDGEPIGGAQVHLASLQGVARQGSSDFRGEFRIGGLEAGSYHLNAMHHTSGFSYQQQIEIPHPSPLDLEVWTAEIRGTVRSIDGAPLAGVRLEAQSGSTPTEDPVGYWIARAGRKATESATDGSYRITKLPEGSWRLVASRDGFTPGEIALDIVQGGDRTGLDFALEPTHGLWLDLRLGPGATMPLAFDVATFGADGGRVALDRVSPDSSGALHLPSLPAGSWQLALAAQGLATTYLRVETPADRPQVILQRQATLEIESTWDEPDTSRSIAVATVTRDDGIVHRLIGFGQAADGWPLLPGRQQIHGVPAGTWTVEVTRPDGTVQQGTVRVAAGETATVALR